MPDPLDHGAPSTAAIAGHPIHPMLVGFPIAFFLAALASDIVFWTGGEAFWAWASFWLLAAGLASGIAAALAGLTDFLTIRRVRQLKVAWFHFLGNGTVLVLAAINLVLRWGAAEAVTGTQLALSAIVGALLGVTGWLGGEMVYKHGIGMSAGTAPPAAMPVRRPAEPSVAPRDSTARRSTGR